jgi:hypothetical protein
MMIAYCIKELRDKLANEQQLTAVRAVIHEFNPVHYDTEDDEAYSDWCMDIGVWALDYIKEHPDWFNQSVADEAKVIIDKYRAAIVKEYGEDILREKGE